MITDQLIDKIAARGMEEEGMEQYLDTFKHGMPPHGGLGIGLERLTMQLLGEENVRESVSVPERPEQTGAVREERRKSDGKDHR